MARTCLPPGFRFHPTDIELIMYYLKRKIMGKKFHFQAISELNIYKFSPWDLPDKSCLKSKDLNWYFFCPRERKYSSGDRMRRGTDTGYWKTTGKDRSIVYKERVVGMVKTLVFHEGCPPKGKRTDWVVYEYRMDDKDLADAGVSQDAYVLYKVFKKNGPGPRNGAQYGAPFNEEEWNDDDSGIPVDIPSDGPSPTVLTLPRNPNSVASKSVIDPVCPSASSLGEAGPSLVQPDPDDVILDGLSNSIVMDMFDPQCTPGWAFAKNGPFPAGPSVNDVPYSPNDDIAHLLVEFTGEGTGCPNEENYELDRLCHGRYNVVAPQLNGNDPFNGLEDLSRAELNVANFPGGPGYIDKMLPQDDMEFLELNDLDAPLKFLEDFVGSEKICTGSSYEVSNADDLSKAGLNGVNFSGGSGYLNNMLPQDDMAFLELNDLDAPLNFPEDFVGSEKIFTGSSYEVSHADAPEHLTGISSTQFSYGAGSREICYNVNFPHSETELPGLSEFPLLPNSSGGHLDSTIVYPMENAYRSVLSQRFAAGYNLHSFSYGQPEESRGAAENQERAGVLQRNFSSRLQQLLLESFTVHPASIVEYYLVPNSAYGDSSIHVKAEVTRSRFNACTKDALSVMLGESTYDYSCWWSLHGAEFWKKVAADCTSGYFLFHFGLILIMWILVLMALFISWLPNFKMHFLFQNDCLLSQLY